MKIKLFFHYISYLKYPLLLIALFYGFKTSDLDSQTGLKNVNSMLVFMGLAISFATLEDSTKTTNKFSKLIWENTKTGKIALLLIGLSSMYLIINGLKGFLSSSDENISEISFGYIVLGIGLIGMLKSGIEKYENHKKDKKTTANTVYN